MLDYTSSNFKSLEELKEIAPSIFTTKGAEGTSDKYTHIPTDRVIQDMELLGWGVVDAKEVKARQNVGFQKHLVVFRNPDVVINGEMVILFTHKYYLPILMMVKIHLPLLQVCLE